MPAKPHVTSPHVHKSSVAEVPAANREEADDSRPQGSEGEGQATGGASAPVAMPSPDLTPAAQEMLKEVDKVGGFTQSVHPLPTAPVLPSLDEAGFCLVQKLAVENQRNLAEFCRQYHKTTPEGIIMLLSMATDHAEVANAAIRQEPVLQRLQAAPLPGQAVCAICGNGFAGGTTYCSTECGAVARRNA